MQPKIHPRVLQRHQVDDPLADSLSGLNGMESRILTILVNQFHDNMNRAYLWYFVARATRLEYLISLIFPVASVFDRQHLAF